MSINLIPPQLKKQRMLEKLIWQFSVGAGITLIILTVTASGAVYYNKWQKNSINRLEAEIANTEEEAKQYADVENSVNLTNAKLKKIDSVNKTRVVWSQILTEIAASTPSQVRVKSLMLDQASEKIALTGEAETRREVARFKEKLDSSPHFNNVFFSSSSINETNQNFTFSLTAELESVK